jgi:tetratricopeptide (TPR) repeat protein
MSRHHLCLLQVSLVLLIVDGGGEAYQARSRDLMLGKDVPQILNADEPDLKPALLKAREGKVDEALALIEEQARKHSDWPPSQLILARLLFAADQGAAARRVLEKASAVAPDHPEIYLTFGSLALNDGRASDAQLNFEKAQALAGSAKGDEKRTKIYRRKAFAGLAAVAEGREDWTAAQKHLTAFLEIDPASGQARQRLGRVLFELDKPEDAFKELSRAVKDAVGLEPAAISMARLYGLKGNLDKSKEWFDYALKVEPASARVRLARGAWLLDQGKASDARTEIEEALKLDPSSKDALRLKAFASWHLRQLPAAEGILEPMHLEAPADLRISNLLALVLIEQDDTAKQSRGLQLAEVNARQSPKSPDALATLGWAHFRAGHLEQAEKILRAAVTGVRTTPDIAYFLARVLAARGQAQDSRKLLESSIKVSAAFTHRDEAKELLQSLSK